MPLLPDGIAGAAMPPTAMRGRYLPRLEDRPMPWLLELSLLGCIAYSPETPSTLAAWGQVTRQWVFCSVAAWLGLRFLHQLFPRSRLAPLMAVMYLTLTPSAFSPGHAEPLLLALAATGLAWSSVKLYLRDGIKTSSVALLSGWMLLGLWLTPHFLWLAPWAVVTLVAAASQATAKWRILALGLLSLGALFLLASNLPPHPPWDLAGRDMLLPAASWYWIPLPFLACGLALAWRPAAGAWRISPLLQVIVLLQLPLALLAGGLIPGIGPAPLALLCPTAFLLCCWGFLNWTNWVRSRRRLDNLVAENQLLIVLGPLALGHLIEFGRRAGFSI